MTEPTEKRKNTASRSLIPLLVVGIVCLCIGAAAAISLRPPERIYMNSNDIHYNLTPTGSFYEVYAVQDIACGSPIDRETASVVQPPNIVVYYQNSQIYPRSPIWQSAEEYLSDPFSLLDKETGDPYAVRNILKGDMLSGRDIIWTTEPNNIPCATPKPD